MIIQDLGSMYNHRLCSEAYTPLKTYAKKIDVNESVQRTCAT